MGLLLGGGRGEAQGMPGRPLRALRALRGLTKVILKECTLFLFVLHEEPQLDGY